MTWMNILKQLTPMQSKLKDIARREGMEKFSDRTMIIRINKKMGDDFDLTLRAKTSGEDRRSAYGFKFRNGELYLAEGPFLVYTASSGKDLYEEFENAINELMNSYRDKNPMPMAEPPKYIGATKDGPFRPADGRGRPKGSGKKRGRRKYMARYRESDRELQRRLDEKYGG